MTLRDCTDELLYVIESAIVCVRWAENQDAFAMSGINTEQLVLVVGVCGGLVL